MNRTALPDQRLFAVVHGAPVTLPKFINVECAETTLSNWLKNFPASCAATKMRNRVKIEREKGRRVYAVDFPDEDTQILFVSLPSNFNQVAITRDESLIAAIYRSACTAGRSIALFVVEPAMNSSSDVMRGRHEPELRSR